tara:strand:+ start:1323 stop:1463 length:141 start_codon:yes stop_codon:yes gene_type:complete
LWQWCFALKLGDGEGYSVEKVEAEPAASGEKVAAGFAEFTALEEGV